MAHSSDLERIWGARPAAQEPTLAPAGEPEPPEPVAHPDPSAAAPAWLPALDELVYELMEAGEILDRDAELLERSPSVLLTDGEDARSPETMAAVSAAAAVGYAARYAEQQCFGDPSGDPAQRAASNGHLEGDLGEHAARLAIEEAIDPDPDDDFKPSWAIPGIPPDQRHLLRERTLRFVIREDADGRLATPEGPVAGAGIDDFRRAWKYGFFVRWLGEVRNRE